MLRLCHQLVPLSVIRKSRRTVSTTRNTERANGCCKQFFLEYRPGVHGWTAHPGGNGFAVSRDLNPKLTDVISLNPLGRETRKHPSAQVRKLQSSIEQFGFVLPVVVDAKRRVVAGWGLVLAARKMGLLQVPAVTIDDL